MANRIKMSLPIVEMDGDEMASVIWKLVKKHLLLPYVDLKTQYYDLGIKNRDHTDDEITTNAANAINKYHVGVKCATITPNEDRVKEYRLRREWDSPNGTIRTILNGTVFRTPIIVSNIKPFIKGWKKPIIIARHAYGDLYKDVEYRVESPGKVELLITYEVGKTDKKTIHEFKGPGVVLGMHNLDDSIESFARSCFRYALDQSCDLVFSSKETISKEYDHKFKDTFYNIFNEEFKEKFKNIGISYFYTLIDDAVARVIRSEGGFIWACKNYDGDIMSDMVAAAYGSLAMMTSVLVSPQDNFLYEAAHGTIQQHYYNYLKGKKTSTNSMAIIFAWTGALKKRGELDDNKPLIEFSNKLEKCAIKTIEEGFITKDLASIADGWKSILNTEEFLVKIKRSLDRNVV